MIMNEFFETVQLQSDVKYQIIYALKTHISLMDARNFEIIRLETTTTRILFCERDRTEMVSGLNCSENGIRNGFKMSFHG